MKTLLDYFATWCRETPEEPAWWFESEGSVAYLTWVEIAQRVLRVASELLIGKPGDRVLTHLPNGLDWVLIDLGCQVNGLIHVPIDMRIPRSSLSKYEHLVRPTQFIRADALPNLLAHQSFSVDRQPNHPFRSELTSTHLADQLCVRNRRDLDVPATILFTSGTSGSPRGVMLSHRNLVANALGKLEAVPQFTSDRRVNLLPFSHAYARTCELSTWILSGSSVLCVSNLAELVRLAPRYQPTLLNAVPYIFEKIREAAESDAAAPELEPTDRATNKKIARQQSLHKLLGGHMRVLATGGAGLSNELFRWFTKLGLPIVQGYGLTEASPVVCSNRSENPKVDCVGPTIRDTLLRIDDEQRLWVKGPGIMLGYWQDDEATKKRIVDGWLDTGDRAEWTEDGSIRILGRCDDLIVLTTGEKVDPSVIEERLVQLPSIHRAVLVGHQQRFVAAIVIVADAGADESQLMKRIQDQLADLPSYCTPKKLVIERNDWSFDEGILNHKGTIIRSAVMAKYRFEIGSLFHPSLGRRQDPLNPGQPEQQAGRQHQHGDGVQQ